MQRFVVQQHGLFVDEDHFVYSMNISTGREMAGAADEIVIQPDHARLLSGHGFTNVNYL
jgi:hypothetical protein